MLKRDAASGKMLVSVCTAQGMLTNWLDPATGTLSRNEADPDKEGQRQSCPFAQTATMAASDGSVSVLLLTRIAQPYRASQTPNIPARGQAPLRLAARGPPQIS